MSVLVGVGPEVNKLEQVSSDDDQMSIVGIPCLVSRGTGTGRGVVGPICQCIVGNDHMTDPARP